MAATTKTPSSSTTFAQTNKHSKPYHCYFSIINLLSLSLLVLFLFFLFTIHPQGEQARPLKMAPITTSFHTRRLLSAPNDEFNHTQTPSATFHPKQSKQPHHTSESTATRAGFQAAAHEVPSGPNPISN